MKKKKKKGFLPLWNCFYRIRINFQKLHNKCTISLKIWAKYTFNGIPGYLWFILHKHIWKTSSKFKTGPAAYGKERVKELHPQHNPALSTLLQVQGRQYDVVLIFKICPAVLPPTHSAWVKHTDYKYQYLPPLTTFAWLIALAMGKTSITEIVIK